METEQEIMKDECPKCKSNNCQRYMDVFVCFNCGYKDGKAKPLKKEDRTNNDFGSEDWKLSGNKNNVKRYNGL